MDVYHDKQHHKGEGYIKIHATTIASKKLISIDSGVYFFRSMIVHEFESDLAMYLHIQQERLEDVIRLS